MSVSRIVKNGRPGHAWYVVAHNFIAEDGYHYRHKHASCSTRPEAERLAETLLRNSQCVYISCGTAQDVCGALEDLVGSPILLAEEVSSEHNETLCGDECWTFYKFATIKGSVTVRWYGSSNGYYSTAVSYSCE